MKVCKLNEVRLNNHQQHLEDLILFGKEGIEELNDKIDKFIRRFDNSNKELNLTQKVDGAPALFVWHKFSGYPDNSIALKGFTSGPNTAMSSVEQIDAKYGDRPGMAEKLKLGLQLAKYIPEGECWQGDCLFSHDDIREEEINGKNYLTFQPNKIVYAFSEENADYDKVANSDFGICFHTIYKDAGNGNKSQSFDVDPTRINAPNNFYIMSPAINVSSNKADYDTDSIEKEYEKLKAVENKLLNDSAYEDLINNQVFMNYWNTFENASLADKKQVNLNASTVINDLKSYVRDKQEKEYNKKIGSIKTNVGKQKATDKFNRDVQELADLIDNNKSTITNIVDAINLAANIKMSMWAGLKQAKNDYSTFYRSRTKGFIPSEGEGIAMSTDDGNIVKIVNRAEFSSINRNDDYLSGFMHESILNEYKKIPVPSEKELINNYITKNLRLDDLANLYNTNITTVKKWLSQYNIKKDKELAALNLSKTLKSRTPEEIANVQAKAKQTSLDRYGDPNYRNSEKNIETNKKNHDGVYVSTNQQKYQDTLKDKFGSVENAYKQRLEKTSKTKELKYGDKNYNNPEKTAKTNLKKYGVRAPIQNKDIYSKMNKPYHYKGEKFSSSWELAYYIYSKDNNINIEHEPVALEYYSNNKKYMYIPDFKVNGNLIEIKGDQFIDSDGSLIDFYGKSDDQKDKDKLKCMIDNNVKILTWKDIKPYVKYIKDTYGKDYLKSFKDNSENKGLEHESLEMHEDYDLNPLLKKLLGDREQEFKQYLRKINIDHTAYNSDVYPLSVYREERDKGSNQELVHKYWLDHFGLDTAQRGVASAISGAITNANHNLEDDDEYKDTLDWDDSNRLPADEQFKMNLFYEWDAIKKDPFGDYSEDDPRKSMSFREFLQDKIDDGDYEDDHEKQLLIKTIEEVKGGSGYFEEMLATQRADMGEFNKKIILDEDGAHPPVVVAFGRMNPPTIGHEKLINKMASLAKGEKAKLYLSHSVNNKKDPLSYDSKIRWCEKAFGDRVDVVESDAKNVFDVLADLYKDGYTDIIYVGGSDRIGGSDDISNTILKYNGNKTNAGDVLYNFDSIKFEDAGQRDPDSNDPSEQASASLVRKLVLEDNFNAFKSYVPFNNDDAYRLFKELKYAMKGAKESFLKEADNRICSLREATRLTKSKYTPEVQDALDKELDKIDTRLNAPDRNKGAEEYKQDLNDYTGLFVKQSSDAGVVYSEKDINKLFPNGDKINDALADLELSVNGTDYKISSTGSAVLGEDNFSSEETTRYQEAISSLILAGRIEAQDVKKYLKESDDIFKYINVEGKDSSSFESKWSNFVNKWGSTFNIEQAQKATFINKANSLLNGDVTSADILHPGVRSPYSAKAGILLSGADTFDKSDVYYCTGDTDSIINSMLEFRKTRNIKGYVQFMVDNVNSIVGVSLKKVSKELRADWDIPPKDASDFTKVYWPETNALTQGLVFDVDDNSYLLAIRPNSKKTGDKGTLEWKEVGGSAQMGKAVTPVRKHFGDEFFSALSKVMVDRDYIQACKMILKVITGKDAVQGGVYNLTNKGKVLISKIFNDGCGFNSSDDSGTRISAPYIKVH